ncbi:MAG: TrmH family RNA methyltransferase [Ilumatobacteraceae bacterium]
MADSQVMEHVDDAADPRVDDFRSLRARESGEVLWAEGPTVVERLVASGLEVRSVLVTPAASERLASSLASVTAPVLVAEQRTLNDIVGFDLHRGAIAVATRPTLPSLQDALEGLGARSTVVVLEGVNDPENLGAIARTSRALGADALLLDPTCADPYYRRTVRVSMGEVLHITVARGSMDAIAEQLTVRRFEIWALTPRSDAERIDRIATPERLALLAGAEGPGLSPALLDRHRGVRVPMREGVDSLNVGHAIAAALAVVQSSTA